MILPGEGELASFFAEILTEFLEISELPAVISNDGAVVGVKTLPKAGFTEQSKVHKTYINVSNSKLQLYMSLSIHKSAFVCL